MKIFSATLKSLKKKYRLAPLMLWYMKHCNYEKLKPTLIKAGMSHIRNESAGEIAYAQDMFETIFKDFKQEKDVHISGLLPGSGLLLREDLLTDREGYVSLSQRICADVSSERLRMDYQ